MAEISATVILEMLGRPAEHVTETLNSLVDKLSKEKGIYIKEKTIHPPLPVENSKDLFTSFAEITLDLDSLDNYFSIIFGYMPAHIEITKPLNLTIQNVYFNDLGNKILQRLHNYDAVTKNALINQERAIKKLMEVAPHLFKQLPKSSEQVTKKSTKPVKTKKKSKKN